MPDVLRLDFATPAELEAAVWERVYPYCFRLVAMEWWTGAAFLPEFRLVGRLGFPLDPETKRPSVGDVFFPSAHRCTSLSLEVIHEEGTTAFECGEGWAKRLSRSVNSHPSAEYGIGLVATRMPGARYVDTHRFDKFAMRNDATIRSRSLRNKDGDSDFDGFEAYARSMLHGHEPRWGTLWRLN